MAFQGDGEKQSEKQLVMGFVPCVWTQRYNFLFLACSCSCCYASCVIVKGCNPEPPPESGVSSGKLPNEVSELTKLRTRTAILSAQVLMQAEQSLYRSVHPSLVIKACILRW